MSMKPGKIRSDFRLFRKTTPPNATHPVNVMLHAAFGVLRNGVDEQGHDWDAGSAQLLDRVYNAGLGNYVARSKPYQEYRDAVEKRADFALEPNYWLSRKLEWVEFKNLLTDTPSASVTKDELLSLATKVRKASLMVKESCSVETGQGPISFCSKYAFFLNRVTPIIDGNAEQGLRTLGLPYPEKRPPYETFVRHIIELLTAVYPRMASFTSEQIKDLDGYLYELGRGRWKFGGGKGVGA